MRKKKRFLKISFID